jgi:hypothetical protein
MAGDPEAIHFDDLSAFLISGPPPVTAKQKTFRQQTQQHAKPNPQNLLTRLVC